MKIFWACAVLALSTPVALAKLNAASPVHPVVDAQSGYLLGGSQNGKWISADATAKQIKGGEAYRVYGVSTQLGETSGSKPKTNEAPCTDTHWVSLRKNYNGVLALGATWNAAARKVRIQNPNQEFYRRAVWRFLKAHGLKKPVVKIAQLWRVDLDGDGTDEVLLSATNYQSTQRPQPNFISSSASAGDYSIVLLRKIVNGKVKTIPLVQEIYPQKKEFSAPDIHRLTGVLDANGDGKMEIVLGSRYYEGDSVSLIEVEGATAKEFSAPVAARKS